MGQYKNAKGWSCDSSAVNGSRKTLWLSFSFLNYKQKATREIDQF